MELNKTVAAASAFIAAVEHMLVRRQPFENLKAIVGRDGKFCFKALLQNVGNLHDLRIVITLMEANAGKGHRRYSSCRHSRAETAAGQPA